MSSLAISNWSYSCVLGRVFNSLRPQFFGIALTLVLIPGLWTWLLELSFGKLETDSSAPKLFALLILECVPWGASTIIAVAVIRAQKVPLRALWDGFKYLPRLLLISLPVSLALVAILATGETAMNALLESETVPYFHVTALLATMYFAARTLLWAPLVVDAGLSLKDAFIQSWRATRRSVWKVAMLGMSLLLVSAVIQAPEYWLKADVEIAGPIFSGLFSLGTAAIYLAAFPGLLKQQPAQA